MNREESRKALINLEDELRKIYTERHVEREEGEFTCNEFAEANGIDTKAAENFIAYGLRMKFMTSRKNVFVNGRLRTVYKKV